ncbi:MAG: TolC family protein [Myxococcaceae bacterium]
MMRLQYSAIALLLLAPSGRALAMEPLTVDAAIRVALEKNPSILFLRADVEAARARLGGAALLLQSNPELEGAFGPRSAPERPTSMDLDVGVQQRIEVFGQRGARKDAAEALLLASEARLDGRKTEVAAAVREAFGRALGAEQQLRVSEEGRAVAGSALKTAEERFSAGAATRIEVNTARVEIGRAIRESTLAEQRKRQVHGELALLVGLDPGELALSGILASAPRAAPSDGDALLQQAMKNRPDLRAARAELEAAKAEQRLALREALPNPRLGVSYGKEENAQIIQGTLGFDLPVFNRNQAARGATAARAGQAERALEAVDRLVRSEVALALGRHRAASIAAEAYASDVLKAMHENTALVTQAYRAGKVNFLELLLIQRQSLEARRGYIDALEELNAADAQLTRAVGSVQ